MYYIMMNKSALWGNKVLVMRPFKFLMEFLIGLPMTECLPGCDN